MMIIIIIITITTMTALTGCHVPATEWCQHYPLSAMLLIFSFQFSLLFFYVGSWKCGKYVSYTWRTAQEKDFELILTIKMKTRHPVEGYFGIEFQAICNQHGVIVALSCKVWNFCEQFLRFFKKRSLTVKFQNFVLNVFTASRIDIVVLKCREICLMGSRRNRALFTDQK